MKTTEELRAYFEGDRFAVENGAEIVELLPNGVKCAMTLTSHHRNALGAVMGGAIFTLADFAFAAAANALDEGAVTLTSEIHYLAPARGDRIYAVATRVRSGRSVCHYRVEVTDAEGCAVAELLVCGYRLK